MVYEFKFPDIGEGIHEGKILQLTKKSGDKIEAGDIIAVVETDKVVADIPAPKDGILKKYGANEGEEITVGSTLAYLEVSEGMEVREIEYIEEAGSVVGEIEGPGDSILPAGNEGRSDSMNNGARYTDGSKKVLATPVARKLASDYNLDISQIQGTGPMGRVMKEDILHHVNGAEAVAALTPVLPAAPPQSVTLSSETQTIEFSTMRKTIAENMEKSHAIPAFLIQDFTTIDDLAAYRKGLKNDHDLRISFQPFFMKAIAAALKKYPMINATFDAAKQEATLYKDINIGIAVDTDDGLMVPVIRQVQSKSIAELGEEMTELVERAKKRLLKLDDLRGGTISITNYGSFGGVYGRPMILAPQVAIIGFGRIHKQPVVNKQEEIVPGLVLPVSMTCDHRVVDGAPAASFLSYLLELLHDMHKLMITL
ncbi:2-oxo acid dehydrogenase subunit E2 [candidate division KSB1 bacterium]|nr:2-oxo acid dehydrogenase subunit E2 [candidate division KSB1 bacterium]